MKIHTGETLNIQGAGGSVLQAILIHFDPKEELFILRFRERAHNCHRNDTRELYQKAFETVFLGRAM